MKRISIVGLFLAAVFAFSAMAASSASAAPGLLLARVAGGGSIVGVSFLSLGLLALLTTTGNLIDCKHVRNHGVFLSATLGDLLILFSSCSTPILGTNERCTSEGEGTEGNIHLPLATTLFHLGLAHLSNTVGKLPAVAVLLDKDVKFKCGALATILVLGAVIGALQLDPSEKPIPLNQPVSNAILNFEQTAHGLQHLRLILFDDVLRTYDLHSTTTVFGKEEPAELAAQVVLSLLDLFRLSNGTHVNIELFENS